MNSSQALPPDQQMQPLTGNRPKRHFLSRGVMGISLLAGCGSVAHAADSRPNILWIGLDDARADVLGSYGAAWATTPNIDRLAAEGVRFHNAIVQNPVCIPSRNSMKTGYYPYEVGPVEMGRTPEVKGDYIDHERMSQLNETSLLDVWTNSGMKPMNLGKLHARHDCINDLGDAPRLVNVRGEPTPFFRQQIGIPEPLYLNDLTAHTKKYQWLIGGILNVKPELTETWRLGDLAVEQLHELSEQEDPFFLRVSFHAPHVGCYVPPEYFVDPALIDLPLPTEEERALKPRFEQGPLHEYAGADLTPEQIGLARGTYFGMINLVDVQIGRILNVLEEQGLLNKTIIAFTSDQGFQLGEHGLWKKRVFYEDNVRTPFILRYPKALPKNKTIEDPVELIDFLPTLLDISGFDVPREIRGRSLMPLINGQVAAWRKATFSEIDHSQSMYDELRQGTGRRVMVRTTDWKLVYFFDSRVADKDGALYHLIEDPGERINLYHDPQYRGVIARLEDLAERWHKGENLFIE